MLTSDFVTYIKVLYQFHMFTKDFVAYSRSNKKKSNIQKKTTKLSNKIVEIVTQKHENKHSIGNYVLF